MAEEPESGIPTAAEPHTGIEATELVETPVTVADDHDHAEGRGLPVARLVAGVVTPTEVAGNATAGWGLVPPGAVVWFRTLAELTAAGAGWTRETTLDGRFPLGAGTTFTQTFTEATSYGTAWSHTHGDDHSHTVGAHDHDLHNHAHSVSAHDHSMQGHTHDLSSHSHTVNSHAHTMGNHTHSITHFHNMNSHAHSGPNHAHSLGNVTNMTGGTAGSLMLALGSVTGDAGTGNTGGPTNNDTSGASAADTGVNNTGTSGESPGTGIPSNNTSSGPSQATTGTSAPVTGGPSTDATSTQVATVTTGKSTDGWGTTTGATTWLPPARAGLWARKL